MKAHYLLYVFCASDRGNNYYTDVKYEGSRGHDNRGLNGQVDGGSKGGDASDVWLPISSVTDCSDLNQPDVFSFSSTLHPDTMALRNIMRFPASVRHQIIMPNLSEEAHSDLGIQNSR